jgi:hypothetical protein
LMCLLCFLQCHKAKNLIPEAGGQSTRTGKSVLEIQVRVHNLLCFLVLLSCDEQNLTSVVALGQCIQA